jgi:hypothetical protein
VSGPIGIHLADTTKEAWDEAEEALHTWVSFYVDRGSPVGRGRPPVGELREKNSAFGGMPYMVGSADEVGERMRAMFRRAPLDEFVLYFHPPGHDDVRRADHARRPQLGTANWDDQAVRRADRPRVSATYACGRALIICRRLVGQAAYWVGVVV